MPFGVHSVQGHALAGAIKAHSIQSHALTGAIKAGTGGGFHIDGPSVSSLNSHGGCVTGGVHYQFPSGTTIGVHSSACIQFGGHPSTTVTHGGVNFSMPL